MKLSKHQTVTGKQNFCLTNFYFSQVQIVHLLHSTCKGQGIPQDQLVSNSKSVRIVLTTEMIDEYDCMRFILALHDIAKHFLLKVQQDLGLKKHIS